MRPLRPLAMTKVCCSVPERCVNPLFEVFEGGDFVLTSYRDVEAPLAEMRIFFEEGDPEPALRRALELVGCEAEIRREEVAEEDWRFAYRRHFKTELVSPHILVAHALDVLGVHPELDETGALRLVLPRLAGRRLARTDMRFLAECATCTHFRPLLSSL